MDRYFLFVKEFFDIKIPTELVISEISWFMNVVTKVSAISFIEKVVTA